MGIDVETQIRVRQSGEEVSRLVVGVSRVTVHVIDVGIPESLDRAVQGAVPAKVLIEHLSHGGAFG
jgi:hypothetical protein